MRAICSDGMPDPVSAISAITRSPSTRVDTDSQPPLGIASRAFRNRFRNTCWSWCSMPSTAAADGDSSRRTLMLPTVELVLEQREDVGDDRVQIDVDPFVRRRAGTRQVEQPVDDLGGAERLPLDLLEQHGLRIVRIGAFEQHLREARDAGQRRVDLVRDAGGEQADRRHLLGNLQLLFEAHAVGDVLDQQQHPDHGVVAADEFCSGTSVAFTSRRGVVVLRATDSGTR